MACKPPNSIFDVLRATVLPCGDEQMSDRDLLRRFVENRDESSFAALVRRHGAMVNGVGLRVLHCSQDAEDVCQATFLLLAKKAASIPWRDSVVNWLYGVAYRLALRARTAANRRSTREKRASSRPQPDALGEITFREFETILDEELCRLPKKHAAPLILCCLEGRTRDEAAQRLGLRLATIKSRLEEGREMLRRRLARRGVALSAGLAGAMLASTAAGALPPAPLVRLTTAAASKILAGDAITGLLSANVLTLTRIGVRTMFLTKLKMAAVLTLVIGILTFGMAGLSNGPLRFPWHNEATAQEIGKQDAKVLPQNEESVEQPSAKSIEGMYVLSQWDDSDEKPIRKMAITARERNSFSVRGLDQAWSGEGRIDGNSGYYNWVFVTGERGKTTITINGDKSLKGEVEGEIAPWTYRARLKTTDDKR